MISKVTPAPPLRRQTGTNSLPTLGGGRKVNILTPMVGWGARMTQTDQKTWASIGLVALLGCTPTLSSPSSARPEKRRRAFLHRLSAKGRTTTPTMDTGWVRRPTRAPDRSRCRPKPLARLPLTVDALSAMDFFPMIPLALPTVVLMMRGSSLTRKDTGVRSATLTSRPVLRRGTMLKVVEERSLPVGQESPRRDSSAGSEI